MEFLTNHTATAAPWPVTFSLSLSRLDITISILSCQTCQNVRPSNSPTPTYGGIWWHMIYDIYKLRPEPYSRWMLPPTFCYLRLIRAKSKSPQTGQVEWAACKLQAGARHRDSFRPSIPPPCDDSPVVKLVVSLVP